MQDKVTLEGLQTQVQTHKRTTHAQTHTYIWENAYINIYAG